MKHFFYILLFLISTAFQYNSGVFNCLSQNQINFWDFHKEKVVEAKLHPSEKYIVSRDALGKIILWETTEFRYIKTLFIPTNNNVTGMRWVRGGNALAVAQNRNLTFSAYQKDRDRFDIDLLDTVNASSDSLFIIPVFDNGKSLQIKASVDFINPDNKRFGIIAHYHETQNVLYSVSSDSSFKGFKISSPFPHHYAADMNTEKNEILIGTSNHSIFDPPLLQLINTENYNTINSLQLDFKPQYILFDDVENNYLIIGSDLKKNKLSYTFFDCATNQLNGIKTIEGETRSLQSEFVHNTYQLNKGHYRIVISISGIDEYIFDYSKGKLNPIKKVFHDKLYQTAPFFIPKKGIIGFLNYQSFNQDQTKMDLQLWDYEHEKKINQFEMRNRPLSEATFLADGSWSVVGNSSVNLNAKFLKYFPKGEPLNNKFSTIYFIDYISEKFNITLINYYHFDSYSGKVVFTGWQDDEHRFFIYDLETDRILEKIEDPQEEYKNPLGFSDSLNRILVSDGIDYSLPNDGFYFVRIIDQEKTLKIKSAVTNSHISTDGQFLLTRDTTNTIRVYNINKKPKEIYSKKFEQEYLSDFKVNANVGFSFSASSFSNGFSLNSYVLATDDNHVNINKIEGYKVCDLWKEKDYTVVLLGLGTSRNLIINHKDSTVFQKNFFNGGYTPYSLSANFKENRLMLNNEEGTTTFIDFKSKEVIGSMIHYNERDQVILSNNGYYSSNIDVSRILSNGESGADKVWINERNSPADVLHLFGTENLDYKDFLTNVRRVNTSQKKELENNLENHEVKIISVKFPELQEKLTTERSTVHTEIEVEGDHNSIAAIEIKINKGLKYVLWREKKEFKILEKTVQFKLDLTNGDNDIEIRLVTTENKFSNSISKLLLNVNSERGNLYYLSIGVSDYQESAYDLVYADKDAMDLALLYGDSSDIDAKMYKTKFYANEYSLNGKNIDFQNKSIYSLSKRLSWEPEPVLNAVDSVGRFWAERQGGNLFLWDFERGTREKLFEEGKKENISLQKFLITLDNSGFFYFTGKSSSFDDEVYYYDFKTRKSSSSTLPENLIQCDSKNRCLVYQIDFSSAQQPVYLKELKMDNGSILNSVNKDTLYNRNSIYGELSLISVSKNLKNILCRNEEDDLILIQKQNSETVIEKLSELKYEMLSNYQFRKNALLVHSKFNDYYERFDIEEKVLTKIDLNKKDVGLNFYSAELLKVYMEEPLEQNIKPEGLSEKSTFQIYSESTPHSFREKHVLCLTNKKATQSSILNAIDSLFNKVTSNDQVVLFMAGHGVLSKNNEFIFAPHDMDYSNPKEKGISYNKIIEKIDLIPTANKLILFDACHSGNVFNVSADLSDEVSTSDKLKGRGAKRVNQSSSYSSSDIQAASDFLFDKVISSTGITVLSASSGDDVAYEGLENLSNGNFTASTISLLMSSLSSSDIYFSLKEEASGLKITEDILYAINKKIINTSQSRQIPNIREINKHANLFLW